MNVTGAVAYDWVGIVNAVLLRMAFAIVGLQDVCAITLIFSIQMAHVGVRFTICSTHWHVLERTKYLADSRSLHNLVFNKTDVSF